MTFFKNIMRILSATLGTIVVLLIPQIKALLSGGAPSDISVTLWAILSAVGLFIINYFLSLKKPPVAPPSASVRR